MTHLFFTICPVPSGNSRQCFRWVKWLLSSFLLEGEVETHIERLVLIWGGTWTWTQLLLVPCSVSLLSCLAAESITGWTGWENATLLFLQRHQGSSLATEVLVLSFLLDLFSPIFFEVTFPFLSMRKACWLVKSIVEMKMLLRRVNQASFFFHLRYTLEQKAVLMFAAAADLVYRCPLSEGLGPPGPFTWFVLSE